jgi:N-acetylmuramoyl-L-alanine amidase
LKTDSPFAHKAVPSPNFGDRRGRSVDALILHYTGMRTGALALARLLDPASEVSCHYLVWEDGGVDQLVAESNRAWHAGRSTWAGETDMNAVSIGIEIVNAGHDGGCPPYPTTQVEAVTKLATDICTRHNIVKRRVLAHSDIAPDRKLDPGEWFPWDRLAASGIGLWSASAPAADDISALGLGSEGEHVIAFQRELREFGYSCPETGIFDSATAEIVAAFQRHYRPAKVSGNGDLQTLEILKILRAPNL